MRSVYLIACGLFYLGMSATAATFIYSNSATPEPAFTGPGAVVVESRVNGADGLVRDTVAATHHEEAARSVTLAVGGGTLTSRSDRKFDSAAGERVVNDGANLTYERTYEFATTLDYSQTAATYGNFSFITVPRLGIGFTAARQISLSLDGPVAISLLLQAAGSRSASTPSTGKGPDLTTTSFFNSLIIYGGEVDILNPVLIESLGGFFADPTGGYRSTGTARGVLYQLDARMTGGGLALDVLLQPEPGGGPVDVEVNFFYQQKNELSFPIAQNGTRTAVGAISGTVSESLTLRSIPEPGVAALALSGGWMLLRRRRHFTGK